MCGKLETDPQDPHAVVNPIVLVEVLSDSTEAYDRGEKFAHYRRIPSLREYMLVWQREPRIEVHRRNEAGRWELYEAGAGESIELATIPWITRPTRTSSPSPAAEASSNRTRYA